MGKEVSKAFCKIDRELNRIFHSGEFSSNAKRSKREREEALARLKDQNVLQSLIDEGYIVRCANYKRGTPAIIYCDGKSCGTLPNAAWGDDVYTSDSNPCICARHCGVVVETPDVYQVVVLEGRDHYGGSVRNGVKTSEYGKWKSSISIQPVGY